MYFKREDVVPHFFEYMSKGPVTRLPLLNFVSASRSTYQRVASLKGAGQRADKLTEEFERKLWVLYVRFHCTGLRVQWCSGSGAMVFSVRVNQNSLYILWRVIKEPKFM